MFNKSYIIWVLLLLLFQEIQAQSKIESITIVHGIVKNANGALVSSCSISVVDSSGNILHSTISDENGRFKINIPQNESFLKVIARHMSYGLYENFINSHSETIEIKMPDKLFEMEEVLVQQAKLSQKGDTLTYLLESFSNQHDRTLADVLSKIPGIEVSQNGQIKLNGTPINRFYVEGKDLMGGRYGVVTNSLPNKDVQSLEILQNHQPIKLLEGRVHSTSAAINIKLKSGITITGRGQSFIGSNQNSLLWQKDITPLLFTKKIQSLISYKGNNTGLDLISQFTDHIISLDHTDQIQTISTGAFLNLNMPLSPSIMNSRFLDNKTHVFSANLLSAFNNNWTTKFNILAYSDLNRSQSDEISRIYFYGQEHSDSLIIENALSFNENKDLLQGSLVLEQNSNSQFLKNNLNFQIAKNQSNNQLVLNKNPLYGNLSSPAFVFQNSFSGIIEISKQFNLQFSSYLNWIQDQQNYKLKTENGLILLDSTDLYDDFLQKSAINAFQTEHTVQTDVFLDKWSVKAYLTFLSSNKTLETGLSFNQLFPSTDSLHHNNSKKKDLNTHVGIQIGFQDSKFKISGNLPVNWEFTEVHSNIKTAMNSIDSRKIFFNPSLRFSYSWNPQIEISGNLSRKGAIDQPDLYYPNYILNGISFTKQLYNSGVRIQNVSNTKITYQFPENSLNVYLTQRLTSTKKDNITQYRLLENGQQFLQQTNYAHKNTSASYRLVANQYLNSIQSQYTFGVGYGISKSPIWLQEDVMQASLKTYDGQLRWMSNFDSRWAISSNFQSKFHHRTSTSDVQNYQEYHHQFSLFYTVYQNHNLVLKSDFSRFIAAELNSSNHFLDLKYTFAWQKKNIDFEIKWSNILKENNFNSVWFSDLMVYESLYRLRPSEILIGMSYQFSSFSKKN